MKMKPIISYDELDGIQEKVVHELVHGDDYDCPWCKDENEAKEWMGHWWMSSLIIALLALGLEFEEE